jgi:DNA-binding NarL/FixJ family response regulator
MALQVFTAVTGAAWESQLVGALDRADHGVTVVRRCVDVSELLAAAATGTGQAVLLSGELRRLDADAVTRLDAAGVAVVGLVEPGNDRAVERLRQLGVRFVLPADAEPDVIARALRDAVADISSA